jgi:hypothetical protein
VFIAVGSGNSPSVEAYRIDTQSGQIKKQRVLDSSEEHLDVYERQEMGGSCDYSDG